MIDRESINEQLAQGEDSGDNLQQALLKGSTGITLLPMMEVTD